MTLNTGKAKVLNYAKPVYVYRNLRHGRNSPPLYSVMQGGKVFLRVHSILLSHCQFIVREAGRQKVLATKRKNVHAFVKGYIVMYEGVANIQLAGPTLSTEVRYNPYHGPYFYTHSDKPFVWPVPVTKARSVMLNEDGISVEYPNQGE